MPEGGRIPKQETVNELLIIDVTNPKGLTGWILLLHLPGRIYSRWTVNAAVCLLVELAQKVCMTTPYQWRREAFAIAACNRDQHTGQTKGTVQGWKNWSAGGESRGKRGKWVINEGNPAEHWASIILSQEIWRKRTQPHLDHTRCLKGKAKSTPAFET